MNAEALVRLTDPESIVFSLLLFPSLFNARYQDGTSCPTDASWTLAFPLECWAYALSSFERRITIRRHQEPGSPSTILSTRSSHNGARLGSFFFPLTISDSSHSISSCIISSSSHCCHRLPIRHRPSSTLPTYLYMADCLHSHFPRRASLQLFKASTRVSLGIIDGHDFRHFFGQLGVVVIGWMVMDRTV